MHFAATTFLRGTWSLDVVIVDTPVVGATVINGVLTPFGDVKEVEIYVYVRKIEKRHPSN